MTVYVHYSLGHWQFGQYNSSGQIYRLLVGYFSPTFSHWLHPLLIALSALLVIFMAQKTVWHRLKPERWGNKSILYLNLVGGLFLALAVFPIIQFWANAKDDTQISWQQVSHLGHYPLQNPPRRQTFTISFWMAMEGRICSNRYMDLVTMNSYPI